MILVKISDADTVLKGIHLGLKISTWCEEQGLEHLKDFEWWLVHTDVKSGVYFRFDDEFESTATYLTLMWVK